MQQQDGFCRLGVVCLLALNRAVSSLSSAAFVWLGASKQERACDLESKGCGYIGAYIGTPCLEQVSQAVLAG